MNADKNELESRLEGSEPPEQPAARARRFPILAVAITTLGLGAIVVARVNAPRWDFQIANMVTFLSVAVIYGTAIVTYLTHGRARIRYRLSVGVLGLLLPVAFFALFRVDGVTGELVPRLTFRWSEPPDRQLPKLRGALNKASGLELGPARTDFPEFLGPDRTNRIDVEIETDWNQHAPILKWRREIGAGWSSFSTRAGYATTMEQRGPTELVTCYDIETGEPVWSHAIEARYENTIGGIGPRGTPTWDEDRVYAHGATGVVRALNGRTGELLWQVDLPVHFGSTTKADAQLVLWGRSASPLIVDQLVVIPYGGPADSRKYSLAAFDKLTGELVWKGGDRQISYASPVLRTLCGVRQIVSVNEDNVSGHDIETGKVLWQAPWPGNSRDGPTVSQPVILPGDRVLLSKGYGGGAKLLQIRYESGHWSASELWASKRLLKTKFTNVAIFGDHAYGLSDGILECIDWKAGKSLWKSRKGRYRQGQILGLRDTILVQAERGYVALVRASPQGFDELARFDAIEGQTWNNLCFAPPHLLVRNATEAACFVLKQ